jgi:Phosphotransferase enzyme family
MTEPGDHVTYRVLVFARDGTEILLTRSGSGLQFPEVSIPKWERVAEKVTFAIERQWGEVIVCLFEPDWSLSPRSPRYIVARHWLSYPSTGLQEISIRDVSEKVFSDAEQYCVLQKSLATCRESSRSRSSFAQLNWFDELCQWAGQAIAAKGLHLTGGFRQLNASPSFSLIRFETNGPAVWFKGVGEPNEREFPITLEIVRNFPRYAPRFVASRTDWNGWLSLEVAGANLAETADLSDWTKAATTLAKLQIESVGRCRTLLDSGAHDLNLGVLDNSVSPFLEVIARLMQEQTKVPPPTISDEGLALLKERIREAVAVLKQSEIPDTLGHLDLNPGNVMVGAADGCAFLDWAEAYVGHPFYSFEYLLEHFRRLAGKDVMAEHALTTAYLGPWTEVVSSKSLTEAMSVAPLLASFAYAAGPDAWRRPELLRDPEIGGYLRSLTRRMNREADQLRERNAPCLS